MDTIPGDDPMQSPLQRPLAGLDPADLLRQGAAEDTFADSGPFVPPSIEQLAADLPQFEILELIGKGGMGAVYKVRQKALDRVVALKILPPEIGAATGFSERFAREAKALAKLNHPGIVTIHEFGRSNSSQTPLYFILMEFVDGVNLRQLLHTGRISPREALAIVPQICDALQFAHDQGIVHRDIKPENILLDRLGRVKVADFGIAKVVASVCDRPTHEEERRSQTDATLHGKVMGTPQYMAPEQIDHPADVDHRADIYALGVVFYQMLTGELPEKNLQAPSRKVRIDVRLDEIVLRALEKDPELRFQQASVLKTRVENLDEDRAAKPPEGARLSYDLNYRSKRTLFGLPLLHVASGLDPETGRERVAKGIVAIGGRAKGVIAVGGIATGGLAIGGVATGAFAFGGLTVGLISFGGLALALVFAIGGLAVGPIAIGGQALGWFSYGAQGYGVHPLGPRIQDPAAIEFFTPWGPEVLVNLAWIGLVLMVLAMGLAVGVPMWLGRNKAGPPSTGWGKLAMMVAVGLLAVGVLLTAILKPNGSRKANQVSPIIVDTSSKTPDPNLQNLPTEEWILERGERKGGVDLDTKRFVIYQPTGGFKDPHGALAWREGNGIDLILDHDSAMPGVLVSGAQVAVAAEWWDELPEVAVVEAALPKWTKSSMFDERMTFLRATGPQADTKTWICRTQPGSVGILRLGPTHRGGGVRAQWRLIVDRHPEVLPMISRVVIEIDAVGGLHVDGKFIPNEALRQELEPILSGNPELGVEVKAGPMVKYARIRELLDSLAGLRIHNLSFSTPGVAPFNTNATSKIGLRVLGEVHRPGTYTLPPGGSLLDALAAAGGWTQNAAIGKISLLPRGKSETEVHDLHAILQGKAINPLLDDGAVVTLSKSLF